MDAGKASMDTVSRRTRSRWDEYYKNQYNGESDGNGGRGKQVRNEVHSDRIFVRNKGGVKIENFESVENSGIESSGSRRSRNVSRKMVETGKDDGDARKRGKKHDFVFGGGGENIEHVESFGSRPSGNVSGKRVVEGKDNNVASEKKRKLDMKSKMDDDFALMGDNDDVILISDDDDVLMSDEDVVFPMSDDDDIVYLGEHVVSNGSSLKTGPESRSGLGSEVGDLDEVVSSVSKKVGSTKVGSVTGEDSRKRGRGRPRIRPQDKEQMHYDVSVTNVGSGSGGNSRKRGRGRPRIKPRDEEEMHYDVPVMNVGSGSAGNSGKRGRGRPRIKPPDKEQLHYDVPVTKIGSGIGGNSGERGRGRPRIKPPYEKQLHYHVPVTKIGSGIGGNSGEHGRGRPPIKPPDKEQMHDGVPVDLKRSINPGNSTDSSDGSDNSDDSYLSQSESTSEIDDELSDEDYKMGAESSDDSDSCNDVELQTDDEYDGENENLREGEEENSPTKVEEKRTLRIHKKSTGMNARKESDDVQENENESYQGYIVDHYGSNRCKKNPNQQELDDVVIISNESEKFSSVGEMNARKESDTEHEKEDESHEGYNVDHHGSNHCKRNSNQQEPDDVVIISNDEEKVSSVRRSTRISTKKETKVELERDDEIDEGYQETNDSCGHDKASANCQKDEDVATITDDEKKFSSIIRKSAKKSKKEDGGLDSTRIFEPCSGYGCMDKASRRINMKKETKVDLERDDEVDEGYHETNDGSVHNKKSANWKKDEDVAISVEDEKKSPSIRKSAEMNTKGDGELDGSTRITEPCSNYSCMDKARKDQNTFGKKKYCAPRKLDMIKSLVESINAQKEEQSTFEENALTPNTLPLKFRFEDEVSPPQEKSEWEKLMDSLFHDLELGLREFETDCTTSAVMENDDLNSSIKIDESPAACCDRGKHQPILDEQRGIVCEYCYAVILEIKHVLPDFYMPPLRRQDRKDSDESPSSFISEFQFPSSPCETTDSTSLARGTVWELIPGVAKEMYPHQHEGFEFIWKNIAGSIIIEKLKQPLADGRGCIISHAPGTGKTRLTIVFLQAFLKLYPTCCPVIIAPRGMLLTWESEFIKWNVDIPFHNLNKKELSGNENAVATQTLGQLGAGIFSKDCIRLLKLSTWTRGGSILGISYTLFEKLAGENGKDGYHEKIKEVLLERPGLLVLDEGHTPRNDRSQIWKALTKVATQRRIILSGTPFQNNLNELYNTLCLVNPKFVSQIENNTSCKTHRQKDRVDRKRWMTLISSIGKNGDDGTEKLRAVLDPFVHVHKGTILQERLPGLRHTLVFLHPTKCQKALLATSSKERKLFRRIRMVSLVSLHPSLEPVMERYPAHKSKLEEIESDVDAGVKAKFVMKLIWFADALGERVLVFSQFIDPLVFLKKQLESQLSWNEGRQLLYMDGKLDEKQRQDSISSFNDYKSEAKVLLASERACSEGINLVGASRVILLDTVWNPSVEKQAISRAYRLGQKKVVYVYRLFTSGIEVRQYAQQIKKERISQLIFSPGDGKTCQSKKSPVTLQDKVLEAMVNLEKFNHIFEKIIYEPKESDLIKIFGLEQN